MTTANDKESYVYVHVRETTGHVFYVGKGKKKRAWTKETRNKYWHRIVNSEGYAVYVLASNMSDADACDLEIRLIAAYKAIGMAEANLTNGGEGSSGYVYTDDHRRNLSAAMKKRFAEDRKSGIINVMCRPDVAEKMGKTKIGNKNCVKWDKYKFHHQLFWHEYCSGYELRIKYGLNQTYVSKLIHGKVQSCKGWIVVNE